MALTTRMKAWILDGPGEPDAFRLIERAIPTPAPGWVVVEVESSGLNRSELFSRRGLSSPDFSFPRVLGLECAGRIADANGTDLDTGQRVVALMGGMGRRFDGSYATHTVVPRSQVFPAPEELPAEVLGAVPETYNTALAVCLGYLRLDGSETVLVRGGTSALGMAAIEIAKDLGCIVIATSRSAGKASLLADRSRADHIVIDGADFVTSVLDAVGAVNAVVECVGSKATIESSAMTMKEGGRVGLVGQLSETWDTDDEPRLPSNVEAEFTASDDTASPKHDARMRNLMECVVAGRYRPNIHHVFAFDEIAEAHRVMGANEAVGKLVVLTRPADRT